MVSSIGYNLALNADRGLDLRLVGIEREPVLVIDNVMCDACALVNYAAREVRFRPPPAADNFYPGVLAPAPLDYARDLVIALQPAVREAFGLENAAPMHATCNYAIVTRAAAELTTAQRLPHVDATDPFQLAFLHYLCDEGFGGTAFYRHRSTGFETLTAARETCHAQALATELSCHPPPAAYIAGDTPLYLQTARVSSCFNRLIVYRSQVLHSGDIRPSLGLDADPQRGRLTANVFREIRPGIGRRAGAARHDRVFGADARARIIFAAFPAR